MTPENLDAIVSRASH